MKIAVEGCAHGELEIIYDTIKLLEEKEDIKVDLLICCGDFQASRNEEDLHCMAIPPKYYNICSFYKYYTGEKEAPILTIFIGGNHEASNHLQELPYGGWVAPNIYYLGYAGVINIAGVRIGGISGIYKGQDYLKGRFEKSPYDNSTKRSVYHIRNLEVFRLKQLSQPIDIFLSHDWPAGIWDHGDVEQLLRFKPFFKNDIDSGKLGSKPCEELLNHLQPEYWFAAHLHCKFAALVQHSDKSTKFLALDKCLPRRRFLQITDIPHDHNSKIELAYDLEWLTILHFTNHLLSVKGVSTFMPGLTSIERSQFTPSQDEKSKILAKFANNLAVPNNFVKTAEGYDPQPSKTKHIHQPQPQMNPQTTSFCTKLGVDDPLVLLDAFVNNSIAELDETVASCGEESEYETFINTPSKLSLNLPEPKFDQSYENESCADVSGKINSTLGAICESSSISAEDDDGVNAEADTNNESSNFKVVNTNSPVPKKFKRRNASIYGSEET